MFIIEEVILIDNSTNLKARKILPNFQLLHYCNFVQKNQKISMHQFVIKL